MNAIANSWMKVDQLQDERANGSQGLFAQDSGSAQMLNFPGSAREFRLALPNKQFYLLGSLLVLAWWKDVFGMDPTFPSYWLRR
jgi:hypothetical protein